MSNSFQKSRLSAVANGMQSSLPSDRAVNRELDILKLDILRRQPREAVIVQFWGDVNREVAASHGLNVWPIEPPPLGHMAVLLSEIGPEPVIRLQAGGLRAAEWIRRGGSPSLNGFAQLVEPT